MRCSIALISCFHQLTGLERPERKNKTRDIDAMSAHRSPNDHAERAVGTPPSCRSANTHGNGCRLFRFGRELPHLASGRDESRLRSRQLGQTGRDMYGSQRSASVELENNRPLPAFSIRTITQSTRSIRSLCLSSAIPASFFYRNGERHASFTSQGDMPQFLRVGTIR